VDNRVVADGIVNGCMILLIGAMRTTFRHLFTQLQITTSGARSSVVHWTPMGFIPKDSDDEDDDDDICQISV